MKDKSSKLVALTLCFAIIFSFDLIKLGHCPPTTLSVSPSSTVVDVSTSFNINITVADVYELISFDIVLTYDTTKMDAQNVDKYPPFTTWLGPPPEINDPAGTVHVMCNAPTPQQSYSGSGPMIKIAFICTALGANSPLHLAGALIGTGGPILFVPIDGSVTQNQPQSPPINVTFRLLAIEHYYSNALSYNFECVGSQDYAMKSAQYLITTLQQYDNWKNLTQSLNGYRYTNHIHLLSNHSSATSLPYYRGPPTNSNVVNEIKNFLAVTDPPWENNSLTIRILYYIGHSGIAAPAPAQSVNGFFLALGDRGSHPASSDPANPSSYEELWDYQLNQTLNHGDLATNNCTLVILDSCRSEGAIQSLKRPGRVVLVACKTAELANGWVSNPGNWPPGTRDRWGFFTGQNAANAFFGNGTAVNGPLGIIGAITFGCDPNNDGWADAKEVFNIANGTTVSYSNGEAKKQVPQHYYGVMSGKIPVVQYNNKTAFPYNGRPFDGTITANLTWPGFNHDPYRSGTTKAPGTTVGTPLWTAPGIGMDTSIVVSEVEAIAASANGSVYGLDLDTGNINWKFNAESAICATPYVDKGIIYVATLGGGGGGGGAGGIIYAIDEATGRILWQYQAAPSTGFYASPTVADGRVFIATTSELDVPCEVSALNQTTGEPLWSRVIETPVKSSPAVGDGFLFIAATTKGGADARLHAFAELTGTKAWNYSFGLSNLVSTPAVVEGQVFIGCVGGAGAPPGLYAFGSLSGLPLWEYLTPMAVSSSPAVDVENDRIIFGCENGLTIALNVTGKEEWTRATGGAGGSVRLEVVAISGAGYVTAQGKDSSGSLLAITYYVCSLNETNGALIGQYTVDGPPTPAAIADNHLFVGTSGSNVYCFGSPFPEHDASVKRIFPDQTTVNQGDPVIIEYSIKNEGNVAQEMTIAPGFFDPGSDPFDAPIALYNDTLTLNPDEQTTRYYAWDTTGAPAGIYKICAVARALQGENDFSDNILVNGTVEIVTPGVHDVAVTNVTPAKTIVCRTMTMKIHVAAANLGVFPETFDVTAKAIPAVGLPIIIGTQTVSLAPSETRILTFVWTTTGASVGSYTIEADATAVPGEINILNNAFSDGQVKVTTLGDINADNIVNIKDATQIGINWMKIVPPADPNVDINDDGIINIKDATIIGTHWMETYP